MSRRPELLLFPVSAFAAALAFLQAPPTDDMVRYVIPWMEFVRNTGASSLSGEFSNYTPPYVYLLYLFSWLVPLIGAAAVIKLISMPFAVLASVGLRAIVLTATGSRAHAWAAACLVFVLPAQFANMFYLGQADVIYASFVIWFVAFAMQARPLAAAIALGLALSFKLQAMLVAPAVLYLVVAGRMKPAHLLALPLTYAAAMVPAVAAGRSWLSCLQVYAGQFEHLRMLTVNAPNVWQIGRKLVSYDVGLILGLTAGTAAGLVIALAPSRFKAGPKTILLVTAASALLLPYLLPKMHDRFFFLADLLTFALAFSLRGTWPAAALCQMGSLVAYMSYIGASPRAALVALVPMTCSVAIIMRALGEAHASTLRRPHAPTRLFD